MKNEPAFPQFDGHHSHVEGPHALLGGLTKREYFAGLMMQGHFSWNNGRPCGLEDLVDWATGAVIAADVLIKELEKTNLDSK